jgi:hypothetical protein
MDIVTPKYVCDAIAIDRSGTQNFISVFKVSDGIDFVNGRGEVKHASPRRTWTARLLKFEIGMAFDAIAVTLQLPEGKARQA